MLDSAHKGETKHQKKIIIYSYPRVQSVTHIYGVICGYLCLYLIMSI